MKIIKFGLLLFLLTILLTLSLTPLSHAEEPAPPPITHTFVKPSETITYIPYKQLDKLFQQNKKLVYIKYTELQELIEKKSQPQNLSPVNFIVRDASLKGIVKEDFITFFTDYKIDVLNRTWTYIPFLSEVAGIKEAVWNKTKATVVLKDGYFQLLTNRKGTYGLTAKFDLPIQESGNAKIIDLTIPNIPIVKVNLEIPGKDLVINTGTGSNKHVSTVEGKTLVHFNLVGDGRMHLEWRPKSSEAEVVKLPEQQVTNIPPHADVVAYNLMSVSDTELNGYTTFDYTIRHSGINQTIISIPQDIEIIDVFGNQIKKDQYTRIKSSKKGQNDSLKIYFNSDVYNNADIKILYKRKFSKVISENTGSTVDIPELYSIDGYTKGQKGYIGVEVNGNVEVSHKKASGHITFIDPKELPYQLTQNSQNPILLAYKYSRINHPLTIQVEKHEDVGVHVAIIQDADVTSVVSSDGESQNQVTYHIKNLSKQYLKFKLPDNAKILSAMVNLQPEKPLKMQDGLYAIRLKTGEELYQVDIYYSQTLNFGFLKPILAKFNLSPIEIVDIPINYVNWHVYLPEKKKYWFFSSFQPGLFYDVGIKNQFGADEPGELSSLFSDKDSAFNERDNRMVQSQVMPPAAPVLESNIAAGGATAIGTLPINIQIPKEGKLFEFNTYLTGTSHVGDIGILYFNHLIHIIIFLLVGFLMWKYCDSAKGLMSSGAGPIFKAVVAVPGFLLIYFLAYIFQGWYVWVSGILAYLYVFGLDLIAPYMSKCKAFYGKFTQ